MYSADRPIILGGVSRNRHIGRSVIRLVIQNNPRISPERFRCPAEGGSSEMPWPASPSNGLAREVDASGSLCAPLGVDVLEALNLFLDGRPAVSNVDI